MDHHITKNVPKKHWLKSIAIYVKKAWKFKMLQKVTNKIKKGFEKEGNEMKSRKTENPRRKRSYVCKCIAHVSASFPPKRSKVTWCLRPNATDRWRRASITKILGPLIYEVSLEGCSRQAHIDHLLPVH